MALSRWAGLVFLRFFAYGAWIAHNLTMQEWMAVSGHPLQLGLHWEDVTFSSRGDFVPLVGWCLPVACERRCIILIQETDHHRNDPAIQALQPGHDLVDYGFNVLLFDLRARGESGGASRSEGDREQWDLPGAIDYVVSRGVPVEVIDQISQPIFFIHGREDPVISAEETDTLHRIFNNPEDRIWLAPGVEHVNVYRKNRTTYVSRVAAFFATHMP